MTSLLGAVAKSVPHTLVTNLGIVKREQKNVPSFIATLLLICIAFVILMFVGLLK
jgi:hypothetical protein